MTMFYDCDPFESFGPKRFTTEPVSIGGGVMRNEAMSVPYDSRFLRCLIESRPFGTYRRIPSVASPSQHNPPGSLGE